MKTQACIWLSPEDRATLEGWVADRNTPQKLVWRSRIVLLSAGRVGKMAIVRAVGKCKRTVDRWQERYVARGLAGLQRDATRRGRKPPLAASVIERVVKMTLHEKPPAATHWSARTLARALSISHTSVQRIWNAHGLKPHLVKTFKLSNDKRFVEKVKDVVGLYLDPPDKALVFSVDEKSQIQALDRTQPGLPMKKGRAGTMTHDYKRNGTTTLFAALNVLDGTVIGQHAPAPGVHPLSQRRRVAGAGAKGDPRHRRQLCDPQASEGAKMAGPASPLDIPLHTHLGVLAQRRRRLLRQTNETPSQARRVPICR